ncbi:Uncharacterized protein BP5553_00595 [Venustampulla echinocandica]|uniref:Mediator of RNA polymerase II transcription subunit 10 n=1 Tax=Venustampulla echinocandica TaxID=2656787 RepID=A0A370TYL2_9HELO|nr:Uncharacterized protein BP5553_00595 [Venustampulla echinocandica]RDL40616.1 Uncharacterized protein BP5553_00595 [Venustampulla echinocandica]
MAPLGQSDHDVVEKQLKEVIQDLYHVMVQVHAYDVAGKPSGSVLANQLNTLATDLQKIYDTARPSASRPDSSRPPVNLPSIPPELINYVDNGRNPDIYTREFVELARRGNQLMKGKIEAFGDFRDVLAAEMARAMPELREDVKKVVVETGGRREVVDEAIGQDAM